MKYSRIVNVLFISSLLLLLPTATPIVEEQLYPQEQEILIISIKTPTVVIDGDFIVPVNLTLSYYNPSLNELVEIGFYIFEDRLEIVDLQRGEYQFNFISSNIARITISQNDVSLTSYLIIAITGFSNFLVLMYQRYFDFSAY